MIDNMSFSNENMSRQIDLLSNNGESVNKHNQNTISIDFLLNESNNIGEEEGFLDYRIDPKYCDIVQVKQIPSLNKALFNEEAPFSKEFGKPKCITISNDGVCASIGGMYGKIYFYDLKKMNGGCMNIEKCGEIKFLYYLHGDDLQLSCHGNGNVLLWDIKNQVIAMAIENEFEFAIIYAHEFIETADTNKKSWKLILGDEDGNKWFLQVDKGIMFGYGYKKTKIFQDVIGVLAQILENHDLLIMCTLDEVKIYRKHNPDMDSPITYKKSALNNLDFEEIEYQNNKKNLRNIVPCAEILREKLTFKEKNNTNCWSYKICISWGDMLDFVCVKKNKISYDSNDIDLTDEYFYSVDGQYRIELKNRVIAIYEMSMSYLLLIDEDMGTTPLYINTKLFHMHLFSRRMINQEIGYRGNLKSKQDKKVKKHFAGTILKHKRSGKLYLLTKRIIFINLQDWKGYINRLVNEDNWIKCFNFYEMLYNHRGRYFLGVNTDKDEQIIQMEPILNIIIKKYLKANIDMEGEKLKEIEYNKDPMNIDADNEDQTLTNFIDWNQIFSLLIELLIKCNKIDLILTYLKAVSEEFSRLDDYYQAQKPYLLKNKLKNIDFDTFKEIATYYTNKDYEKEVLSSLALNLDTSRIDKLFLVTICYESQLFLPLVYILTSDDKLDYIMCLNIILRRMDEKQSDMEEMGYLILTIITFTFNKKWFNPRETSAKEIPDNQYITICTQILTWFQEKNIFMKLAEFDLIRVLQCLEQLFESPCYDIISNNEQILSLLINEISGDMHEDLLLKVKEFLLYEGSIRTNKQLDKASKTIFEEENSNDQSKLSESEMIQETLKQKQRVNFKVNFYFFYLKIAIKEQMLLKSKEVFFAQEKIFELNGENCNFFILTKNFSLYDIENVLTAIFLKYGQRFLKSNLEIISHWAEYYQLKRLESKLLFSFKEYKKAFSIILDYKNPKKLQLFSFKMIKEVLSSPASLDKVSQIIFKESVLFYLRDLIILDKSESEKVQDVMFAFEEAKLIEYLKGFPDLQLDYVEKLLKKDNFNIELKEQHIDLLCRLKPNRVLVELEKQNFSLDMLIQYCEKYNVKKALCILYKRIGSYKKAIKVYLETIDNIISKVNYLGVFTIKYRKKLENAFNETLYLIKNISTPTIEESEKLLFGFITSFINIFQTHKNKYKDNQLQITDNSEANFYNGNPDNDIFSVSSEEMISRQNSMDRTPEKKNVMESLLWNYLNEIIDNIFDQMPIDKLEDFYLNSDYFETQDVEVKDFIYAKLSWNLKKEYNLYKYSSKCMSEGIWELDNMAYTLYQKGSKPAPSCQICGKKILISRKVQLNSSPSNLEGKLSVAAQNLNNLSYKQDDVVFRVKEDYTKDCFHQECKFKIYNINLLNDDISQAANSKTRSKKSTNVSKSTMNKSFNDLENMEEGDLLDALNDFMDARSDDNNESDTSLGKSDSVTSLDQDEKMLMRIKFADNIMSRYNKEIEL